MDAAVRKSLARWPNVPAVYGWLRLDARGNWLLRTSAGGVFARIGNPNLRAFIARNYGPDERGAWFFQNGPQRVFVRLERAPLVFRLRGEEPQDHCGWAAGRLEGAWVDERGALFLEGERGLGVLDDRDLAAAWAGMVDRRGAPLGDRLAALIEGDETVEAFLRLGTARVRLGRLESAQLPGRFRFILDPGEASPRAA